MKYSLAVPFLERIVSLAVDGGFTGQITANSFMKREFGKKLIEEFFPRVDLTHVIDTSGAYIPGRRHADGDSLRSEPEAGGQARSARSWAFAASQHAGRSVRRDWSGRRSWRRSTARLTERIRQRRRLAARVVPQAPVVDWRRRGGGVEGAGLDEVAGSDSCRHLDDRLASHASRWTTMYSSCLTAAACEAGVSRQRYRADGRRAIVCEIGVLADSMWLFFPTTLTSPCEVSLRRIPQYVTYGLHERAWRTT